MSEALARALCSADGLDPDARERGAGPLWEHYQTQAALILADPAPLLAALAEAGVLTEERRLVCSCGSVRGGAWKPHFEGDDHELAKEWRYVTDWTEDHPMTLAEQADAADPVQAVTEALIAHTRRAVGGRCSCGHVVPLGCSLVEHQAEAAVAAARPAIEREAKAETERLRHLLGSHADGHLCTCEMIDPGVYHGENMHPPEWEQDPWCPTHPDVEHIKTEVAARLAAVEALANGPAGDGYRPYAVSIGAETHLAVLLDDLRAALATGTTTNPQEGKRSDD